MSQKPDFITPLVINANALLIKTVHYLSYDKSDLALTITLQNVNFIFMFDFREDNSNTAFLNVTQSSLMSSDKANDANRSSNEPPMPDIRPFLLTFINFDRPTPVYNNKPIRICNLHNHTLLMRAKVVRPYPDANFREMTFSFYISTAEVKA